MGSPRFILAPLCAWVLVGCAGAGGDETASKPRPAHRVTSEARKADLRPGELIDYAGHRCGNQYTPVKAHLCLFPRRQ